MTDDHMMAIRGRLTQLSSLSGILFSFWLFHKLPLVQVFERLGELRHGISKVSNSERNYNIKFNSQIFENSVFVREIEIFW